MKSNADAAPLLRNRPSACRLPFGSSMRMLPRNSRGRKLPSSSMFSYPYWLYSSRSIRARTMPAHSPPMGSDASSSALKCALPKALPSSKRRCMSRSDDSIRPCSDVAIRWLRSRPIIMSMASRPTSEFSVPYATSLSRKPEISPEKCSVPNRSMTEGSAADGSPPNRRNSMPAPAVVTCSRDTRPSI